MKYLIAFCLNMCSAMQISRKIKSFPKFYGFQKKVIMFQNILMTIASLKTCMNLRNNMRILIINGCKYEVYDEKNYEKAANLISHNHHRIKG